MQKAAQKHVLYQKTIVFCFVFHPHMFRRDPVVRMFVSVFQSFPPWMSQMIGAGTEGCESRGQRGGVWETEKKRNIKSAFALQFGMTLIIWSGPFWESRRLSVTTDADYTKQGCLEGCVNKTQALTRTCRAAAGAPSSVLIDCNYCSFLENLGVQVIVYYLRWHRPM